MTIIPTHFRGKIPPKGAIEAALKAAEEEAKREKKQAPQDLSNVPVITSFGTHWHIDDILYRDEHYTAGLSKTLIGDGAEHTQDEWITRYEKAIDDCEFYTPDFPALYGIVKALYTARDDISQAAQIAEAQEFLKNTSREMWLMTLTRISYHPAGKDLIIHNFGTRNRYEKSVDFITLNEWIKNTSKPASYQALLDTQDSVQEINSVFNWLNGTDARSWKVNPRPDDIDKRVARFDADSNWAGLNCEGDPSVSNSSLGVRLNKKILGAAA